MLGYDFWFFYLAAQALLAGTSPYLVDGFFSPITLAYAFVPLAVLPPNVALAIWGCVNLVCLVWLTKRRAFVAVLFAPIMFAIYVGQMDIPILALGLLGGWPGLVFVTVKPQLAIWLWGFWATRQPKKLLVATPVTLIIYAVSLLVNPGWVSQWLSASPGVSTYASRASSAFGFMSLTHALLCIPLVAAALVVFFILKPKTENFFAFVAIFNPLSNIYSLSVLARDVGLLEVAISWAILPVALALHTGAPWVVVPIVILAKRVLRRY